MQFNIASVIAVAALLATSTSASSNAISGLATSTPASSNAISGAVSATESVSNAALTGVAAPVDYSKYGSHKLGMSAPGSKTVSPISNAIISGVSTPTAELELAAAPKATGVCWTLVHGGMPTCAQGPCPQEMSFDGAASTPGHLIGGAAGTRQGAAGATTMRLRHRPVANFVNRVAGARKLDSAAQSMDFTAPKTANLMTKAAQRMELNAPKSATLIKNAAKSVSLALSGTPMFFDATAMECPSMLGASPSTYSPTSPARGRMVLGAGGKTNTPKLLGGDAGSRAPKVLGDDAGSQQGYVGGVSRR